MPVQKLADFKDCSQMGGGLLQDAALMKLVVLSALHIVAEPWILITSTTIKNCLVKCGFSTGRVGINDDSVVKITEDKENDWHSLQLLGV
jgi:hypothetical protein